MLKRLAHLILKQDQLTKLQRLFWIRITTNFFIEHPGDFQWVNPRVPCAFVPITLENCRQVGDFREDSRIIQYREKIAGEEIGYFAELDGKMVGSIWASINRTHLPKTVRGYMKLKPNEGLIHDIVTGERSRGMGVGPFMTSRMAGVLLKEYGVSRIVIDVNSRNRPSLRMMEKAGLERAEKMIYVSAFGTLLFSVKLSDLREERYI